MHLIGDKARGFLLELMLTKTRLLCPDGVQASGVERGRPPQTRLARFLLYVV